MVLLPFQLHLSAKNVASHTSCLSSVVLATGKSVAGDVVLGSWVQLTYHFHLNHLHSSPVACNVSYDCEQLPSMSASLTATTKPASDCKSGTLILSIEAPFYMRKQQPLPFKSCLETGKLSCHVLFCFSSFSSCEKQPDMLSATSFHEGVPSRDACLCTVNVSHYRRAACMFVV